MMLNLKLKTQDNEEAVLYIIYKTEDVLIKQEGAHMNKELEINFFQLTVNPLPIKRFQKIRKDLNCRPVRKKIV